MTLLYLFALLAGMFSLALLVLPTVRVLQGRLDPRAVLGLWISGAGFGLLAAAGLVLEGDDAQTAVLLGVTGAIVGWLVQRSTVMAAKAEDSGDEGPGDGPRGPASGSGPSSPGPGSPQA